MDTPAAPFYVSIIHTVEDLDKASHRIVRLIPEVSHLNFVFQVNKSDLYDRLRLPWHFITSIKKCQTNPQHLKIKLDEVKYNSPAFQDTLPERYFPQCQKTIVVKFCNRKDRHDLVNSLKLDGLILKSDVAHVYAPQTLEYKWAYMYIPRRIEDKDEEQDEEQDEEEQDDPSEEDEDYIVLDEEDDLNYPRMVFECGLDQSAIRPLASNCKADQSQASYEEGDSIEYRTSGLLRYLSLICPC